MKLSIRLQMIFDLVSPCESVADVGSDHAYLCCALVRQKKCERAYALDIANGPLRNGQKFIDEQGLTNQVSSILSDGLLNFHENVDCIIIAGMGVNTAIHIIEQSFNQFKNASQIIVQVNKTSHIFRQYLSNHHYTILDESCCFEQHDYEVIKFNMNYHESYHDNQIYLGPVLMNKTDPKVIEHFIRLQSLNEYIANQLQNNDQMKRDIIDKRLYWLNEIIKKES